MTKVKEIEEAISKLPKSDISELVKWLDNFIADEWDQEFEDDVKAGKLDQIAEKAIADYQAGKCKEL